MADYPDSIKSFTDPSATDKMDSTTVPHAQLHTDVNSEIVAIETELGTDPAGTYSDVAARLDALADATGGDLSATNASVATLQTDVTVLEGSVASLQTDVVALEASSASTQTDVINLQASSSSTQTDISTLQASSATTASDILALQGSINEISSTTSNTFSIGDGTSASHKTIEAQNGDADQPFLSYNETDNQWVFSNDGTTSAAIGSGGGGGGTRGTFTDGDLTLGVLTLTHNEALSAPYTSSISIFDNTFKQIIPDEVTGSINDMAIDVSSFTALSGTWGYLLYN